MEFFAREAQNREDASKDKAVTDIDSEGVEWQRIEREIYSPFWGAVHNLVAHPMLVFYRPWGERLHEWTAGKMYKVIEGRTPVTTDHD